MSLAFEILQWALLIVVFSGRQRLQLKIEDMERRLNRAEKELLSAEAQVAALENTASCCFCAQEWEWGEREQIKGGAWIHRNEDGKMVFCGRQGSSP